MTLPTFSLHPMYTLSSLLHDQTGYLQLALVTVAMFLGAFTMVNQPSYVASPVPVVVPILNGTAPAAPVVETPAAPQAPKTSPVVAAPIQKCTPPSFGAATKVDLNNKVAGLTEIIDNPTYYRVYGNTAAQIKTQLRECPAVSVDGASFAAATNGIITWQYDSTSQGNGLCVLSNVKVGLHTRMILPEWQATAKAANGLAAQWQGVINATVVHETEHVSIYQQHARQLLSNLEAMPATECASIDANVKAKTTAAIAALDAAQAGLDVHTNHGVAQGAMLR